MWLGQGEGNGRSKGPGEAIIQSFVDNVIESGFYSSSTKSLCGTVNMGMTRAD